MENKSSGFARIIGEGDIDRVKARIQEKYNFTPPDEYVFDFIAFVNSIAGESFNEPDTSGDDDQDEISGGQSIG